jgi:3-dehydroquinate synthetase
MGVAAEIARGRSLVDARFVEAQDGALLALGLPTRVPTSVSTERLLLSIRSDKKRRAGTLHTFVLPRRTGPPVVAEDVSEAEVEVALNLRRDRRRGSRGRR